ncbi:MAG TPA: DUF1214 domain-containing protein [Gaiellaceae bacterium]
MSPRLFLAALAALSLALIPTAGASHATSRASNDYAIARSYVVRFYPRWFTYRQAQLAGRTVNRLVGPVRMSPAWGIVVAPNDDTIYTAAQLDLSQGPQILTIPATEVTYSLLTLDVWGNIFHTSIGAQTPGTYALVGPGWQGDLPTGVTKVQVPYNTSEWIIRADKYSASGTNEIPQAEEFRARLRLTSLAEYRSDPSSGRTLVVPIESYAPRLKVVADEAFETQPTTFLRTLQRALHASSTRPLSASDKELSRRFDRLFNHASELTRSRIILGAQVAHTQIVDHWQSHTGTTNWVYFGNIGQWGKHYLDRAALTEYVQLGNGPTTAGYYNAFVDSRGLPLDTSVEPAYILTFSKDQIPQAKRFWSLTAYLPVSVTFFPNPENKYLVARYTPGLHTNSDGSISIYIQPTKPVGVPEANWLPVPEGPFNLLLRVYGPEGNTSPGTYTPPAIEPTFSH